MRCINIYLINIIIYIYILIYPNSWYLIYNNLIIKNIYIKINKEFVSH